MTRIKKVVTENQAEAPVLCNAICLEIIVFHKFPSIVTIVTIIKAEIS